VACVLDWNKTDTAECYCMATGASSSSSGPMALVLALSTTQGRPVRWEYPLSFKAPGALSGAGQALALRVGQQTRATNKERCGFVNASWFDVDGGLVKDAARVVAMQGYLLKRGAKLASRRVRRFFVLAPPFLLCYDSLVHAAVDFGKSRALPHAANSAVRMSAVMTRVLHDGEYEFGVQAGDKTWVLCASSKEELDRWVNALQFWTRAGSGKEAIASAVVT